MAALSGFSHAHRRSTFGGEAMAADLENTLYLDVPAGRVVIEMRPRSGAGDRRADQDAGAPGLL